ncbi:hypothetical protein ACFWOT_18360 [Streptomyces sp. NPDC058440]|uniref:hypothetical protein n=1 Tax=Streptomyces sp. NPDC058440 TaxID=3346501 RepID=UPI0036541913
MDTDTDVTTEGEEHGELDDAGDSAAAVVRRLLAALALPVELAVLDPARDRAEPAWSPTGPRLDSLPEVNVAAAERAAELGVQVLPSGDGADELLGAPRFAIAAGSLGPGGSRAVCTVGGAGRAIARSEISE